jgi:hypothetical protein
VFVSNPALSVLADVVYPPAEKVTPGTAGFVTMFLLALAVLLLILSMVRHLRKIRYSVEPESAAPTTSVAKTTSGENVVPGPDSQP